MLALKHNGYQKYINKHTVKSTLHYHITKLIFIHLTLSSCYCLVNSSSSLWGTFAHAHMLQYHLYSKLYWHIDISKSILRNRIWRLGGGLIYIPGRDRWGSQKASMCHWWMRFALRCYGHCWAVMADMWGTVSVEWQSGVMASIFKKGDQRVCSNFRGITLLSFQGKALTDCKTSYPEGAIRIPFLLWNSGPTMLHVFCGLGKGLWPFPL